MWTESLSLSLGLGLGDGAVKQALYCTCVIKHRSHLQNLDAFTAGGGKPQKIFFGRDQHSLTRNRPEFDDFIFRIRMMIGEEAAADDHGARILQGSREFLRPSDAGKGEDLFARKTASVRCKMSTQH